jgi:hypothetical protein
MRLLRSPLPIEATPTQSTKSAGQASRNQNCNSKSYRRRQGKDEQRHRSVNCATSEKFVLAELTRDFSSLFRRGSRF